MKSLITLICAIILLASCGKDKVQKTTYFVVVSTGAYSTSNGTALFNIAATDQSSQSNLTGTHWFTYEFENGKTVSVTATLTQGKTDLILEIYKGTEIDAKNLVYKGFDSKEVTGWIIVK